MKPTIGVLLGDPCGVGPELVAKLLAEPDVDEAANLVVIGDLRAFRMGEAVAGLSTPLDVIADIGDADFEGGGTVFLDFPTIEPSEVTPGRATAAGGRSVYETLKEAIRLARAGAIDGLCFAPYNKYALKLGGAPTGDEHVLFARELGYDGPRCELNVLGDLWTTRVTSHVPIKEVAEKITTERVLLMTRRPLTLLSPQRRRHLSLKRRLHDRLNHATQIIFVRSDQRFHINPSSSTLVLGHGVHTSP